MKRPAALAVVLTLFLTLVACKSGGAAKAPPPSGATVPTAAPTTSTTNPYAVPATIDAAYVNRVLAGLDVAEGDVLRTLKSTKSLTPEIVDRIKGFNANLQTAEVLLSSYQLDLQRGFTDYVAQPGNTHTTVISLITTRPACIFAKVDRDVSALVPSTNPAIRTQWVALRPVAATTTNPTGWGYEYNGFESNRQAPKADPCANY